MREIRTPGLTWRGLETGLLLYSYRASPRPYRRASEITIRPPPPQYSFDCEGAEDIFKSPLIMRL